MYCLLFRNLPFPNLRGQILHGSSPHLSRSGWIPIEHSDFVRHDSDTTIRVDGGSGRQKSALDDVRLDSAHSGVPHDGLPTVCASRPAACSLFWRSSATAVATCDHGYDGHRIFIDPGHYVAVSCLYRGPVETGHCLRPDDHDSKHRLVRLQPVDWMGERLQPRRGRQPGRVPPRYVDLLDVGVPGGYVRFPAAATRNRSPWPWSGDDHDRDWGLEDGF